MYALHMPSSSAFSAVCKCSKNEYVVNVVPLFSKFVFSSPFVDLDVHEGLSIAQAA